MAFLLSCISTKHSMLKKHWSQTKQEQQQTECPLTVLGSREKPKEDQGGLVALFDESGHILARLNMTMPAGMVLNEDNDFLIATNFDVHTVSRDLSGVQEETISLPSFNMLHSLSRSRQGYLVASTGLDVIVEFNRQGELLWDWWAIDHGFDKTPVGELREIDRSVDYRGVKFGTLAQTTHVNSVCELPDGTVLATFFHQGTIVAIDRDSGNWHTVLEGLDHPHSVRVLNEDYITVASTGYGKAHLVHLVNGVGSIEATVDAQTSWLQDSYYDPRKDCWYLVDGKNSQIILRTGTAGEKEQGRLEMDPEWRLYEVLPI